MIDYSYSYPIQSLFDDQEDLLVVRRATRPLFSMTIDFVAANKNSI